MQQHMSTKGQSGIPSPRSLPFLSALGQKRTCAVKRPCPLHPRSDAKCDTIEIADAALSFTPPQRPAGRGEQDGQSGMKYNRWPQELADVKVDR